MRKVISTDSAPKAIGPYSQAIHVSGVSSMSGLVFCSGQIGIDPSTGGLVEGGVEAETRCALENLKVVLRSAGVDFCDIVRTTLYLTDMQDFSAVNAIYAEYFSGAPPARSTVGVASLPRGARFEVDAIAITV